MIARSRPKIGKSTARSRPIKGKTSFLTPKETMDNLVYNNIMWFIIHSVTLTVIVAMATIDQVTGAKIFWQGPEYARNILIQNLDQLWAIWGVIMASGIASGVLIYFQIWRPYKAEVNDQVDQR